MVAYEKWLLWETVDCSRAAGCGGESNDGSGDWYVDGDSGCVSYWFGGSEGDKADDYESDCDDIDDNDNSWDCAVDVAQEGGGGNANKSLLW